MGFDIQKYFMISLEPNVAFTKAFPLAPLLGITVIVLEVSEILVRLVECDQIGLRLFGT